MAVHSNASKRYAVWCLPPIAVAFGPSRIGICRPRGIKRRRSQLGRQVLTELASFKPFQVAEKAATENLNFLEERMVEMPQPPTTFADVMLAQEIRAFVRHQKSPINFVINSMADRRVLGAILTAPVRLTGLKDAEWDLVRSRARQALHPEQTEMQKLLTAALDDLRGGVAATKRVLLERCEIDDVMASPGQSASRGRAGRSRGRRWRLLKDFDPSTQPEVALPAPPI